jgi:DNA-binding PadR family transcriptional regulator
VSHRFPSQVEALVLALLAEHGDLYGLELVTLSKGALKRGTVYVTLGRMEEKGLLRSLRDPEAGRHGGLPRRRYRLTALGSQALELARAYGASVRAATRTA